MPRSSIVSLASLPEAERAAFLDVLSLNAAAAMPWLWELWAHEGHQMPPQGDWRIWAILGGRGAGKTRAGAEWVRARVEGPGPLCPGLCRRVALVGETIEQVRAVMVEGDSGILACSPPDRRPELQATRNKLVWPNGAEASLVSAANPEALRGPQFDAAWSDELAKWRRCRETWDMLQFCVRLPDATGADPRQLVTTTPRDTSVLRAILADPATVTTAAGTAANAANLAPGFVTGLEARYGGTALGRQEIEGRLVETVEGALWTRARLEDCRVAEAPPLDRIVIAVDPPAGSGARVDECGIVAAGIAHDKGDPHAWHLYVLADHSAQGEGPHDWARRCIRAYESHQADRIVAEVNQGGDMVEAVLRHEAPHLSYRPVRASRGKRLRAEPVAALYEQGRVHHVGAFEALEDQMCSYDGLSLPGGGSPDRLDALVWALSDLAGSAAGRGGARVRRL